MSEERIQFDLIERFTAPLPEFYQRRIIFWQDEDREFESMLDELYIPDVTILKLTGTNNFAVKKLLLHDDLTGNSLMLTQRIIGCWILKNSVKNTVPTSSPRA